MSGRLFQVTGVPGSITGCLRQSLAVQPGHEALFTAMERGTCWRESADGLVMDVVFLP